MPSSALPQITVLGSLNMDMVTVTSHMPKGGETLMAESFSTGCGGKGANQAIAAARLSRLEPGRSLANVHMVGAVGADEFGTKLKEELEKDGVRTEHVHQIVGEATGIANIVVEKPTGENRIMVATGANVHAPGPEHVGGYGDALLCQLECPLDLVLKHIKAAKRKDQSTITILNPSPVAKLPDDIYTQIDYLVLNAAEAGTLSEMPLEEPYDIEVLEQITSHFLWRCDVRLGVIITLGKHGVYYAIEDPDPESGTNSQTNQLLPANDVEACDTTGAGDTFLGAFTFAIASRALRSREDLKQIFSAADAVRFGMQAAELAVQRPGAQTSIPVLSDVQEWHTKLASAFP